MIKELYKKENTEKSRMFMSAYKNAGLEEWGYIEEEYFFTGTANVYGRDFAGRKQVLAADAPYTNRFVVRRPADLSKASGRVVTEIVNTSSTMDIDRSWVLLYEQLMRNGDVYVGVTSKPNTMKTLRKFDPKRYEELSWNNPRKCALPEYALGNFEHHSSPETEDGLFWDMLLELGELIRKENCFLGGLEVKWSYLMGWSQSGAYLVTYTNWFAKERAEKGLAPIFDGIYSMAPGPGVNNMLNQEESLDVDNMTVHYSNVPYYTLHTESENAKLGTAESRIANSDDPNLLYRIQEIAGATHDCVFSMDTYYKDRSDQLKVSVFLTYPGYEHNPNDMPYQLAYHRGLLNLYEWTEQGILPPVIDPIPVLDGMKNETDADGNAVGGWRLPEIDLPVCRYVQHATPLKPTMNTWLYGCEMPFTPEQLKERYVSLEHYRELAVQKAREAVKKRLLVEDDVEYCVEHAVRKAAKYGLE